MTTHDTPSAGNPAAAVVPDFGPLDDLIAGLDLMLDALEPSLESAPAPGADDADPDRIWRETATRLARTARGNYLRMSDERRSAAAAAGDRWWRALLASWRPAVSAELLDQLVETRTGQLIELTPDPRTSHGTAWPGSSDYHPDPGPAHPLTAAHTLLSAPGAPSLRGRAAAA